MLHNILFGVCVLILLAALKYRNSTSQARLPPGPSPLPLFGNLLSLGNLAHIPISEYMNKYKYKIITMYFGKFRVVFIRDPEVLHEAFVAKSKNFSNRPIMDSVAIALRTREGFQDLSFGNGEKWRHYRKTVASAFTKTKVKTFHLHLAEELAEFNKQVQQIANNGLPVDFYSVTKRYTLNILQRVAFGSSFPYRDMDANELSAKFIRQVEAILTLLGPTNYISDYVPVLWFADREKKRVLKQECEVACAMMAKELEAHKSKLDPENPKDLLDAILVESLHCSENGLFNEQDIISIGIDMYIAGTDTSAVAIEWFLYFLATYPEYQDRIFTEISQTIGTSQMPNYAENAKTPILNATIKETFRMRPPTPFGLPHVNEEDDYLDGYFIPKNTLVFWNMYGYSYNTDVWGDPTAFRPERFLTTKHESTPLYSFGKGPRMCVGASLAEEEVYQACALLCQRYVWRLETSTIELDNGILTIVLRPHPFKLFFSCR